MSALRILLPVLLVAAVAAAALLVSSPGGKRAPAPAPAPTPTAERPPAPSRVPAAGSEDATGWGREPEESADEEPALEDLDVPALRRRMAETEDLREATRAAILLAGRSPETAGVAEALAEGLLIPEISRTEEAKAALLSLGPGAARAVPVLERIVRDDDEADMRDALEVLGRLDDPSAQDVLLAAIRGDFGEVVTTAALRRAVRADLRVQEAILARFAEADRLRRLLAALAFSRVEPPPSSPGIHGALRAGAGDPDPAVAGSALVALVRAGVPGPDDGTRIGRWLVDPEVHARIRRGWAAALVRGGAQADAALRIAATHEGEPGLVVFEARRSLWRRGDPIGPMLDAMEHLLIHGTLGARVELGEFARELGPAAAPLVPRLRKIADSEPDPPFLADHAREALQVLD